MKPPTCYYYRKEGHLISSFPEKRRVAQKQNSMEPKPNGFIAKPSYLAPASEDTLPRVPTKKTRASPMSEDSSQSKSVMNIFKPFIHNGSVSLSSNTSDSIPIKIWEKLESAVFTVVCVLWEVVHWCKCSNQRNQLRVYPSATSHSSCISSLEMIGNLETSDSCGSSWFSSFLADSVDAVGIARVLSLRRKKIVKKNSPKCIRKVGKSLECWSLAWRISFSSFKNREKLNSSIFGREKMRVLERRVAKFATLYSSSFIFLQFDWLLQTSLEIWLVVLC